jgi:hypothetical protein
MVGCLYLEGKQAVFVQLDVEFFTLSYLPRKSPQAPFENLRAQ